jgi:tetratricopeptide (TPR) repeat protein
MTQRLAAQQAREAKHMLGAAVCASRVRAHVLAARALARLGGGDIEARALIDQAEAMFSQLPASEVDNTALGFTERQFWFTVGNAYTNLGMSGEASDAQQRALALYQPTEYLDPALIRLDQATCLMRTKQADAACELATAAIAAAPEQHRSGLITHYGREFYNTLPTPARALPAARQLHEVLMAQG